MLHKTMSLSRKKSIKLCGAAIFSNICQLVGFSVDYQSMASLNGKFGLVLNMIQYLSECFSIKT